MRTERLIDYRELAHTNMEAEMSQDLQLASWRPKRADGVIPVQKPVGSRLTRAGKVPFALRGSAFLFYSGLPLTG